MFTKYDIHIPQHLDILCLNFGAVVMASAHCNERRMTDISLHLPIKTIEYEEKAILTLKHIQQAPLIALELEARGTAFCCCIQGCLLA